MSNSHRNEDAEKNTSGRLKVNENGFPEGIPTVYFNPLPSPNLNDIEEDPLDAKVI